MKKLIILFLLSISVCGFSQTDIEKYNDLSTKITKVDNKFNFRLNSYSKTKKTAQDLRITGMAINIAAIAVGTFIIADYPKHMYIPASMAVVGTGFNLMSLIYDRSAVTDLNAESEYKYSNEHRTVDLNQIKEKYEPR